MIHNVSEREVIMKCFLFALFAFLSALSYSASISWGTDSVVNGPSGASEWSGKAFLYMVESTSGQAPSWSQDSGWNTTGATFVASGTVENGSIYITSEVDQTTQFKPEGSGYYYVIVYTTEDVSSLEQLLNGFYALSDSQELFDGGTLPGSDEHMGDVYFNADGQLSWSQATSIPEPTVLALLALGMAGLALKRRVA